MQVNQTRALRITAAAALLAVTGAASALDFSANIELDNTARSGNKYNLAANAGDKGLTQSGRVELNASGKAGKNWFVAGKASFLAKKDGSVATDDMWVQIGQQSFDVKLGRFEAVDLFPLPGDTLIEETGTVVKTNKLRGRFGDNDFHAAVTAKLGAGLAAEVGLLDSTVFQETKGVRAALTYGNGPLAAGFGVENGSQDGVRNSDFTGFGGYAQYDFGGFKVTGNFATNEQDTGPNTSVKSNAFALVGSFGPANLGLLQGKTKGLPNTTTFYGSYTLPLFDVKGASITPAVSTSKTGSTKANGVRVRINYAF